MEALPFIIGKLFVDQKEKFKERKLGAVPEY
jgi:hypothetical protein